jgi:hypothetical protein
MPEQVRTARAPKKRSGKITAISKTAFCPSFIREKNAGERAIKTIIFMSKTHFYAKNMNHI